MPNRFRSRARGPFGWFITIAGWTLVGAKAAADWIGRSTIFDDAALLQTRAGGVIEFLGNQTALWFYLTAFAMVAVGLFLALPVERLLPMIGRLKKVEGQNFRNREVPLDGFHYDKCQFDAVTFVYNGGKSKLTDSQIGNHEVRTDDSRAEAFVRLLFELGHIKSAARGAHGVISRDTVGEIGGRVPVNPVPFPARNVADEPPAPVPELDFPFRKAVLQVGPLKSSRSKTGEIFLDASCQIEIRNETAKDLKDCSIQLVGITSSGGTEATDIPLTKQAFTVTKHASQRFVFITRDLKDVVSRPPHLLRTAGRGIPLRDGETYLLNLELRSEYQYPTLVVIRVQVPSDPQGAVLAEVVEQKPDDRP